MSSSSHAFLRRETQYFWDHCVASIQNFLRTSLLVLNYSNAFHLRCRLTELRFRGLRGGVWRIQILEGAHFMQQRCKCCNTSRLNCVVMYTHQVEDNVLKQITIMPNGKNIFEMFCINIISLTFQDTLLNFSDLDQMVWSERIMSTLSNILIWIEQYWFWLQSQCWEREWRWGARMLIRIAHDLYSPWQCWIGLDELDASRARQASGDCKKVSGGNGLLVLDD